MHLLGYVWVCNNGNCILTNMATKNVHEICDPNHSRTRLFALCMKVLCVLWHCVHCIMCRYLFSSIKVFRLLLMSAITMFPSPPCTGLLGSPMGGGQEGGGMAALSWPDDTFGFAPVAVPWLLSGDMTLVGLLQL